MKVVCTKYIEYCYHQCPYFGLDGGEMVCEHSDAPNKGYIISHPECLSGFPKFCPLVKTENGE